MGAIELEIGHVIKEVIKSPAQTEVLLRKMALVIERQALALKTVLWYKDHIDRATLLDEELFKDIQAMRLSVLPKVEPSEGTLETTFKDSAP